MNIFRRLLIRAGVAGVLVASLSAPFLLTNASASTTSATTTSTTMVFRPGADATVSSVYPNTNYGTATTLKADSSPNVHTHLRFTVSGTGGLPITSAKLRFYAKSSSSYGVSAAPVSNNSWGETTITYNNMPMAGSNIASSSAVTGGTWVTINVSSYVKSTGTFGFAIRTAGSTIITLDSRESGSTTAPQLVITLGSSTIKHVFDIWMENHSYTQVWNTGSTPYITSLGNTYVRATNFYATKHPSLPNYLDFFGGSNYSITTDCSPSSSCHISAKNLGDLLEAKGLTWKSYEESMPSPCYLTTSGNYAPKHNPAVYFDDIRTNKTRCDGKDVNFSALSTDLGSAASTPNFAFITPNLCDDMHSCSISTGDNWLKGHVPAILNSPACTLDKCLVVVTWDEDNGSSGNHVLTIFAGSGAKTGGVTSSVKYTHYSMLRTAEYIFGLPTLTSNDANASPMTDMLR